MGDVDHGNLADMTWLTADRPGGVHVIPLEDSLEHRESPGCPCAPKVSLVDGPPVLLDKRWTASFSKDVQMPMASLVLCRYVRNLIVHNAMDGRDTT